MPCYESSLDQFTSTVCAESAECLLLVLADAVCCDAQEKQKLFFSEQRPLVVALASSLKLYSKCFVIVFCCIACLAMPSCCLLGASQHTSFCSCPCDLYSFYGFLLLGPSHDLLPTPLHLSLPALCLPSELCAPRMPVLLLQAKLHQIGLISGGVLSAVSAVYKYHVPFPFPISQLVLQNLFWWYPLPEGCFDGFLTPQLIHICSLSAALSCYPLQQCIWYPLQEGCFGGFLTPHLTPTLYILCCFILLPLQQCMWYPLHEGCFNGLLTFTYPQSCNFMLLYPITAAAMHVVSSV